MIIDLRHHPGLAVAHEVHEPIAELLADQQLVSAGGVRVSAAEQDRQWQALVDVNGQKARERRATRDELLGAVYPGRGLE